MKTDMQLVTIVAHTKRLSIEKSASDTSILYIITCTISYNLLCSCALKMTATTNAGEKMRSSDTHRQNTQTIHLCLRVPDVLGSSLVTGLARFTKKRAWSSHGWFI